MMMLRERERGGGGGGRERERERERERDAAYQLQPSREGSVWQHDQFFLFSLWYLSNMIVVVH